MFRKCNEIVQEATTGRNLSDIFHVLIHFWQLGIISTVKVTKVSCGLFSSCHVTMLCCQDAAGQQGQWHHQHRLRGPAGQVSCDWSEYHNTDLWLAGQDRAAHGHRQREPGDGGGPPGEQSGDQGRAAACHQWGVRGGGRGAARPWGVHTCGGRALGELGVEFSTLFFDGFP